ncbi:MAG: biotin--[Bacteroidales bacterium]|nr:biotin--[acetyl-CoA-carboxylase] ligase [Bacteroidales bacterium]
MAQNKNIIWLKSTDSTNNRALDGIDIYPDGSVWAALHQSAGRGQRGNSWQSAEGENLTFSILFKPDFILAQEQFVISAAVAIGITNYLISKGIEAKIKWPNDIYVADKKICGILIENIISGENLSSSICGIGLNLNQLTFHPDLPNPTSVLRERIGQAREKSTVLKFSLEHELELLVDEVFAQYSAAKREKLVNGNFNPIYNTYHSKLYRLGQYHSFIETATGQRFTAKIIGITELACLLLQYPDGSTRAFAFKEISYVI